MMLQSYEKTRTKPKKNRFFFSFSCANALFFDYLRKLACPNITQMM